MIILFKFWAILGCVALLLIAIQKNTGWFFKFDKPLYKKNFIEVLAIVTVTYIFIPLTIPKSIITLFSTK